VVSIPGEESTNGEPLAERGRIVLKAMRGIFLAGFS
jgi:hypothetical protein